MKTVCLISAIALSLSSLPAQGPKPIVGGQEKVTQKQDPKQKDPKQQGTKTGDKVAQKSGAGKTDPKRVDENKPKETKVLAPVTDDPLPIGADPADLRAMRGAQQMLVAEAKLKEMIKSGKIKNVDQILTFEEVSSWPYEDGLKGMPKGLKKLDGKKVMMTGFMLPIDEVENIKEFLLVQSLWSCCFGQPPDINGTVRVVMQGKKRIDYKFEPIKVLGTFRIKPTIEDGFCVDIYQLETKDVEVIK